MERAWATEQDALLIVRHFNARLFINKVCGVLADDYDGDRGTQTGALSYQQAIGRSPRTLPWGDPERLVPVPSVRVERLQKDGSSVLMRAALCHDFGMSRHHCCLIALRLSAGT
jgi:hypothetical protein